MILISAHLDRVVQNYDLAYKDGQHIGLLDNFAGVLLSYLVLYDDQNLRTLEAKGDVGIWHGKGEEWGLLEGAPKLTKKDVALVVDVCAGAEYCGYDFALENFSGFTKAQVRNMKTHLTEMEGFHVLCGDHRWTNDPAKEDETWQWRKKGIKTLCFTIPIQCEKDGWHRFQQDSTVDYDTMSTCRQGLKRLINYLLG